MRSTPPRGRRCRTARGGGLPDARRVDGEGDGAGEARRLPPPNAVGERRRRRRERREPPTRGENQRRHGAGRSAPPAVPLFRTDRRARTPSLPLPEAVAVGQHRRPVACCRRCSWRAPCPAPSAFVAPCRLPPSPSGRPAARRRGWIWPSHGHRRPSAAPTLPTPAPLGGSSKEADLAALPPSPPVRRSRTADLADAALASAGTPPLLRRRFRRSAQRHRHLRRFLYVGERKRGGRGKERKC